MSRQNKYDDPDFFQRYNAMPRSVAGLSAAGEWPALRALLPDLAGKHVLDLGCGFGWHARHARAAGASKVVGVDLSERMLARARAETDDPGITYVRSAIEDIDFPPDSLDVVLSSLAFHYVERFDLACQRVSHCLAEGGWFILSVEHPVFTALAAQDWIRDAEGQLLHWPLDLYQDEGERRTTWLAEGVVKYHRTVATLVNTVIDAGFTIVRISEPEPPAEMIAGRPELADERRRPMFLLISAQKRTAVQPSGPSARLS